MFAGGLYHVTFRGGRRGAIYRDDAERTAWLDVFGGVCVRGGRGSGLAIKHFRVALLMWDCKTSEHPAGIFNSLYLVRVCCRRLRAATGSFWRKYGASVVAAPV